MPDEVGRSHSYQRFLERQKFWEQRAVLVEQRQADSHRRQLHQQERKRQRAHDRKRKREHDRQKIVEAMARQLAIEASAALFWERVDVCEPDECWEWRGSRSDAGYGVLSWRWFEVGPYKTTGAHRVALALHLGRPLTKFALHSCDNPPCCNPAHLREGTHSENAKDAVARNRLQALDCQEEADLMRHLHRVDGWTVVDFLKRQWCSRREIVRVLAGEKWRSAAQPLCCAECKPLIVKP